MIPVTSTIYRGITYPKIFPWQPELARLQLSKEEKKRFVVGNRLGAEKTTCIRFRLRSGTLLQLFVHLMKGSCRLNRYTSSAVHKFALVRL